MSFYQQQQQQQPHVPPAGYGQPQQPQQPQDYMRFQNVSPEMVSFGLSAGQDMLSKQREKWMPGVFGFWLTLKSYFAVNNSYVLKKLSLILYPFANKSWARLPADEFERGEGEQITHKWALPRNDLNAPDLYIPLMAFITYILLCGFDAGLRSASSRSFSPEIIIQATWRCVALLAVEGCAAKVGLNLLSVSVPFLDVFSYAGYKFVPLCLNILARMLHPTLNVLLSLASSGMVAYFVLKTVASVVPPSAAGAQGTQRYMVLFGFAAAQLALVLVMSML